MQNDSRKCLMKSKDPLFSFIIVIVTVFITLLLYLIPLPVPRHTNEPDIIKNGMYCTNGDE